MLVFIGGITYGELASIRYLNKVNDDKKFIVLTTGMINSRKILNSMRQGKYKYTISDENIVIGYLCIEPFHRISDLNRYVALHSNKKLFEKIGMGWLRIA